MGRANWRCARHDERSYRSPPETSARGERIDRDSQHPSQVRLKIRKRWPTMRSRQDGLHADEEDKDAISARRTNQLAPDTTSKAAGAPPSQSEEGPSPLPSACRCSSRPSPPSRSRCRRMKIDAWELRNFDGDDEMSATPAGSGDSRVLVRGRGRSDRSSNVGNRGRRGNRDSEKWRQPNRKA